MYKTPWGNWQNYTLLICVTLILIAYIILLSYVTYEYSVINDVLAIRVLVSNKLKHSHIVYLRNTDVRFYKGGARLSRELFHRRKFCYLPFFGGLFKIAAICFDTPKHTRIRLLFKPSAQMVTVIEEVMANKIMYPQEDTFL